MYAATVIFSSTVPRGRTNKIGHNEFLKFTYATIVYQTNKSRFVEEFNNGKKKMELKEKLYSMY